MKEVERELRERLSIGRSSTVRYEPLSWGDEYIVVNIGFAFCWVEEDPKGGVEFRLGQNFFPYRYSPDDSSRGTSDVIGLDLERETGKFLQLVGVGRHVHLLTNEVSAQVISPDGTVVEDIAPGRISLMPLSQWVTIRVDEFNLSVTSVRDQYGEIPLLTLS